jgi:ABC-type phosphate/phosphonate transport system ATPase subunit
MGRSRFDELVQEMKTTNFIDSLERIYLYGSSGSGKSHMLAALAFKLVREGKRVLYFPDCVTLARDFESCLRQAMSFAFYDSDLLKIINSACLEDLVRIWMSQKERHYLLVDQLNALENHDDGPSIRSTLERMALHHHYIFSASANEKTNKEVMRKQTGTVAITFHGGMDEVRSDFVALY